MNPRINHTKSTDHLNRTIVFLLDTLQTGGAEKSLLSVASKFSRYKPVFVTLFNKSNDDLMSEFDAAHIPVINLGLKPSYDFNEMAKVAARQIIPLQPALIHSTLFKSDMVSRSLVKHIPVPLINSLVNNSYSKQRYQSEPLSIKFKLWLLQQWDTLTARNVNLFLSNSDAIKTTNANALRIPLQRIKVIYRGRSLEPFEQISQVQIEALHKVLSIENKKVFLNVSRLIDRKGQLDLIRAFHRVLGLRNDCVLLISGEGPYRKILEEEIAALHLGDHVRLLGNRTDIPLLLKAADYFVFPSHYEGLPGALIEAMFARVPIIASLIPENRECVGDTMALFHGVGNVEELALQMEKAINEEKWKERTEAAFNYAMEHFEISKIAQQYEELYDELLVGGESRQ